MMGKVGLPSVSSQLLQLPQFGEIKIQRHPVSDQFLKRVDDLCQERILAVRSDEAMDAKKKIEELENANRLPAVVAERITEEINFFKNSGDDKSILDDAILAVTPTFDDKKRPIVQMEIFDLNKKQIAGMEMKFTDDHDTHFKKSRAFMYRVKEYTKHQKEAEEAESMEVKLAKLGEKSLSALKKVLTAKHSDLA